MCVAASRGYLVSDLVVNEDLMDYAGAASTGSGRGRGVESDEARNTAYEGSTASGARSGATGATGTQGYSSGTTGSTTTGSAGVTEGVRGLNITDKSGVSGIVQAQYWQFSV